VHCETETRNVKAIEAEFWEEVFQTRLQAQSADPLGEFAESLRFLGGFV